MVARFYSRYFRATAFKAVPRALGGLFTVFLTILAGCRAEEMSELSKVSVTGTENVELAGLTLVGYNYTDREIAQFSVNGSGGGNLQVSGPNGGGGGSVCCVNYVPGIEGKQYRIRWHATSCRYGESGAGAAYSYSLHRFYKELDVTVVAPEVNNPRYFEVHFFPDGTVKAKVTAEASPSILSLASDRKAGRSPQCPNNVEPSNAGNS